MSLFYVSVAIGSGVTVTADTNALAAARRARRRTLRANSERVVNYFWKRTEPGEEKAGIYLEQVPGLTRLLTATGPIRGAWWTGSRLFVVAGSQFLEVYRNWSTTLRGTLETSSGRVDMAQGLFSLVCVDGLHGYAFTLASDAFGRITDEDFYGADRVGFLDGKFIFNRPGTQQFYWSEGIDTATAYDALDFASAESAPDNVVSLLIDHRELWLFGEYTTEVWFSNPQGDQVYQRNNGASIESGCIATHTARQMDNSVFWLSSDKNGAGMVMTAGGAGGYQPLRISTQDVEESLALSSDLSQAFAFTYQMDGQSFYVLQVPDLETTWVYEASTRKWHERADWAVGEFVPWRADVHVFAFGRRIVGDSEGNLYELDPWEYTNDGDVLPRLWVSPHAATPNRNRTTFDKLRLDVVTGETLSGLSPVIEMGYSNDGGYTWSDWKRASLGQLGQRLLVQWLRLGMGRDRVWRFRVTDNVKASLIGYKVTSRGGAS